MSEQDKYMAQVDRYSPAIWSLVQSISLMADWPDTAQTREEIKELRRRLRVLLELE